MKLKRLLLLLVFAAFPSFAAYQQQGFSNYQELDGQVNFVCTGQCFVLIGPMTGGDYITIDGILQGKGSVGYGFVVGQQIVPGETLQIDGNTTVNQQFFFNTSQFYSQVPKDAQIVVIVQGTVNGSQIHMNMGILSFFEKFGNGVKQALEYKEFSPRTINFLEGPMRNGVYINQYFFWWIVVLLAIALAFYLFSTDRKNKQKSMWFGIGVLVFFRIFFDLFSTVNEVKMYQQTTSATNIMENGRAGRTSDFYQFLDFIKTKVPAGSKGSFIAPYPFDFEGKYHIYPDVTFDLLTGVDYIFFYNPYGTQNPFDFKDPIYASGVLTWNNLIFSVQQEIVRQPYAKIYKVVSKYSKLH